MLNDSQLGIAEVRIKRFTERLAGGSGPLGPHEFSDHLRLVKRIERQLGGTRKHLAHLAHARSPVPMARGQVGASRARLARVERALTRYLMALVARAPDRPKTWQAVQFRGPNTVHDLFAEVDRGKGVINVVNKMMKQLDQAQFTAVVRHDLQTGQAIITQGQPQQLDTLTGLLMMIAALLEALRMQGFLRRAS